MPTRELCVQVAEDLKRAGRLLGTRVLAVYGGRAYEPQVEALRAGIDVVVGTPGRLLDLARQRHLDLSGVRTLVLDEADEMLDLGFLPDVESILERVPTSRQTMLFSATMPGPVVALSRRFLTRPVHIRAEMPDESRTVPTTRQHVFRAHALDKAEVLARVLQAEGRGLAMVFVRTKRTADKIALDLSERGFAAAAVHGDLGQGAREQALRAFRSGKVDMLVATDVAARGIDVAGVTHVINYQCPEDEKIYLHRIGRTGRAGEKGVAVTFVDWDDLARWRMVNEALKLPFPDPPETYSTSDHSLRGARHPARAPRAPFPATSGYVRVLRPSRSRTSARPAGATGRAPHRPPAPVARDPSGRRPNAPHARGFVRGAARRRQRSSTLPSPKLPLLPTIRAASAGGAGAAVAAGAAAAPATATRVSPKPADHSRRDHRTPMPGGWRFMSMLTPTPDG